MGHVLKSDNKNRCRGRCLLDSFTFIIYHCANPAEHCAGNKGILYFQCAFLDDDRTHGTLALVQL